MESANLTKFSADTFVSWDSIPCLRCYKRLIASNACSVLAASDA